MATDQIYECHGCREIVTYESLEWDDDIGRSRCPYCRSTDLEEIDAVEEDDDGEAR